MSGIAGGQHDHRDGIIGRFGLHGRRVLLMLLSAGILGQFVAAISFQTQQRQTADGRYTFGGFKSDSGDRNARSIKFLN